MEKLKLDIHQTVDVPENSAGLANALAKLATDILAAKQAGLTGTALVAAIGVATLTDLSTALTNVAGIETEAKTSPIGVAEAFALAGFKVARSLTGK